MTLWQDQDKASLSERASLLVAVRAKTNARADRTGRAAAADAPAPKNNSHNGPNDCCVASAAFGAGGKFGTADDVALHRCANVATTGFCVLLASLAERCYSN